MLGYNVTMYKIHIQGMHYLVPEIRTKKKKDRKKQNKTETQKQTELIAL